MEHLSSERAITNRQGIHCESASSEVQLSALLPCVWNQGMYFWLSAFLLEPCLSGSSLNEPKQCK